MSNAVSKTTVKIHWIALSVLLTTAFALAQDEDGNEISDAIAIDEIVVIGGQKPGDEVDLNALYEDEMRARLMRDLEVIKQEEDEGRWNKTEAALVETPPRIRWGYDPDAEARMRRETDLMGVQRETTQPASLFRVEF